MDLGMLKIDRIWYRLAYTPLKMDSPKTGRSVKTRRVSLVLLRVLLLKEARQQHDKI